MDFVSGVLRETYQVTVALRVDTISINDLGQDRLYLLWGISSETTDPRLT